MGEREIIVYTMTGCHYCDGVKQYLTEKGLDFAERNVLDDDQAMADFKKLGFKGTPVTVIDGEPIVGFDRAKFDEMFAD